MKILTYNPRNPNASSLLTFGTLDGQVSLQNGIPSTVEDSQVAYLQENDEEFRLCIKKEIITVKDASTPPVSQTEEITKEDADEGIESQASGEVMVPKSTTTKTITTKK